MSEAAVARADHAPLIIGRYALFDALASGGMATVHLGRLLGSDGFGRTVAVKRLHSHYASDEDFVTMFMDEARIVARIRHPNVVPMIDILESSKGLFLIMEYVHGESYSKLLRTCRAKKEPIPIKLVTAVLHGVLLGLHAAHETKGVHGELLDVVHRDVSPQNIIVGADGTARVLDFGVAKAAGRAQVTREGQIKGKLAYMAPEQIRGKVDRRADVFAAAVVLWESLAGRRLHEGAKDVEIVTRVVKGEFPRPIDFRADIPPELDEITMRGLEGDPDKRYQNARDMALDLERKVGIASPREVGEWVERLAKDILQERADKVSAMEKASGALVPLESAPPPALEGPEPTAILSEVGSGELASTPRPPESEPGLSSTHSSVSESRSFTGTAMGTEMPAPAPQRRRDIAPIVALLSFCAALAIVGALLGGFSLYARKTATVPSATAPSAPPPPSVRASPSSGPSTSRASPSVTASSSSSARAPDRASPDGGSAATTTVAPAPTYRAPAPQPAQPKKNCEPPYTVDEAGHRHYKMECMGTE